LVFSSRRRHTTFSRDWSSDVCSSDLPAHEQVHGEQQNHRHHQLDDQARDAQIFREGLAALAVLALPVGRLLGQLLRRRGDAVLRSEERRVGKGGWGRVTTSRSWTTVL